LKSHEIRTRFLDFYAARGHRIVPSSSLVPTDDPTLKFANAGMNQFKSVLLGLEQRDYRRAASVQKCMRVAGKHNDLEAVGRDARHHTFFEMLGNWSFGDYYKRESIRWGWEFLTQECGIDRERLWASVYRDDDESYAIWRDEIGLPEARIVRLGDIAAGDEENFWSMAETGPCGPCAEIHYDRGAELACAHPDGCALGICDCDRWLELWNHVFMEFDRQEDGRLVPLPFKSVDTGLGFERLAAVLQGAASDYETDLFQPLIARVAELSGRAPRGQDRISMQVIADHARAVAFTIADGARPGNVDRGYVVRRILRRASRHGHLLGLDRPFLWRLVEVVSDIMGGAYPELDERRRTVEELIRREEERFLRTLATGLEIYNGFRERLRSEGRDELSGEEAFLLHDTYGFPLDLTAVVAAEDGFAVDEAGFRRCMERQREQSRVEARYMEGVSAWRALEDGADLAGYHNRFVGYDRLATTSEAVAVRAGGRDASDRPLTHVLCDETPFYAEAGGQVGDVGTLTLLPTGEMLPITGAVAAPEGSVCVVPGDVDDVEPKLRAAERVELRVDRERRLGAMRHHTATHLLHAALRAVLGEHVEQAGSVVAPDRLRFDFRHDGPLDAEQLRRVEQLVNARILENQPVVVEEDVPLAEARDRGAMALFGEKYGDNVRVIEIRSGEGAIPPARDGSGGENGGAPAGAVWSLELCGGTHCRRTGDVGLFRITSESGVAAGVRRVEAIAGAAALARADAEHTELDRARALVPRDAGPLAEQIEALLAERDALRRELARTQRASARDALQDALAEPQAVGDLRLVAAQVAVESRQALLELGDFVRDRLSERGVVVLGGEPEGKPTVIVTITPDLVASERLHAGRLVKALAARAGGRGGGKPHTAQGGLPDATDLAFAVAAAAEVVADQAGGARDPT
jgi:alanyl-tRNA synthetase